MSSEAQSHEYDAPDFYSRLQNDRSNYHTYKLPSEQNLPAAAESAPAASGSQRTVLHLSKVRTKENIEKIIKQLDLPQLEDFVAIFPIGREGNDGEMFGLITEDQEKFAVKRYKTGVNTAVLPFFETLRSYDANTLSEAEQKNFRLVRRAAVPVGWVVHLEEKCLAFEWFSERSRDLSAADLASVRAQLDLVHKLGFVHLDVTLRNVMRLKADAVLVDYDAVCKLNRVPLGPLPPESSPNAQKREPVDVDDDEHLWAQLLTAAGTAASANASYSTPAAALTPAPPAAAPTPSPEPEAKAAESKEAPAPPADPEAAAPQKPKPLSDKSSFKLDTPDIAYSNDNHTATRAASNGDYYRTVVGSTPFPAKGRHSVTFTLTIPTTGHGNGIFVGLCPPSISRVYAHLGEDPATGWGVWSSNGKKVANGKPEKFGPKFRQAGTHVIKMDVDFDADTLSYSLDGKALGIAYRGSGHMLKSKSPLHPAVTLLEEGQAVTLS